MTVKDIPAPPDWPEEIIEPAEVIETRVEEPAIEGEVIEEVTALVPMTAVPPTHHLVVGMGTLAAMSEEEFTAKLDMVARGQERIRIIQDRLLKAGEDYGRVPGISRPFLHQPGAEKLANVYGFAVRQEAERVAGDGVTTPPLAYHVKSFVHLGDFSGPIIAQGYGEANSWEEKYRWRQAKPTCPKCGREGLVRGRADGPLKGKWWCPGRDGGCNAKFEPGEIPPPGKVENTDPWSLAETLIQMASKRSLVSSIRRATGTSGLFTQDDDSPSVQQQSADSGDVPDEAPVVTAGPSGVVAGRGATTDVPTQAQLDQLVRLSKEKDIGAAGIAALLERLFKVPVQPTSRAVTGAVKALTSAQVGKLLLAMDTGEVPA